MCSRNLETATEAQLAEAARMGFLPYATRRLCFDMVHN